MKFISSLVFIVILSTKSNASDVKMPLLDLRFEEYQAWYKRMPKLKSMSGSDSKIEASINGGEKMSQWLKLVNSKRSEGQKIRLTSKDSRGKGIPITKPNKYGPSTINKKYDDLLKEMPSILKSVIYGNKTISSSLPVNDETFVKWAKKTKRLYGTAVRWTGMQPWLDSLTARRKSDVRGYYYLNNMDNIDQKLRNYIDLDQDQKAKIKEALVGICFNSVGKFSKCKRIVNEGISSNRLQDVKKRYWESAVRRWDSFYKISRPRRDVVWNDISQMDIVFKTPSDNVVADWLKVNVEDEFKSEKLGWNMVMNFSDEDIDGMAYLKFSPNVTPHVKGGNIIVMDANTPLDEYDTKWTIRHEYGHILRLPDCYVEFYVPEENLMVNYQLDVTDLMCSRAGNMNDRIYNELKRVYFE